MSSHGAFEWTELMTHDAERAKRFYQASIGWSFDAMPMPEGTYWVAKMGDKPAGGIFEMKGPSFEGVPEHWLPYLAVDDVDERVRTATQHGAAVMRPPFDVPDIGRIAILRQPGGAAIGLLRPSYG